MRGQTGPSIMLLHTGVSVLLSPGYSVIKCECMINAVCLSDLRFSLVCVQEETWGHYSCGFLDKRLNVSAYKSKRKCVLRLRYVYTVLTGI